MVNNLPSGHRGFWLTPRNGPLSIEQTETRRLAYAIKSIASSSADFDAAARDMAALITCPCWHFSGAFHIIVQQPYWVWRGTWQDVSAADDAVEV